MSPEELRVQSFLRLGYFIDFAEKWQPIDWSRLDTSRYDGVPEEELIRIGIEKLRESFSALFQTGRRHVVPISGGLDSRLILGALLEHTEAVNIESYTFGIQGTYDYELGCKVAAATGTRHTAFSFADFRYDTGELLDMAERSACQAVLFNHPPIWQLDARYRDAVIWSGYVGDAVAGSHLHEPKSPTLDAAKRLHLSNRTFVRSMQLYTATPDDLVPHMGGGEQDPQQLSWDEQVLFDEAVAKFTAPLVLFRGFEYVTPLINTPWMDFLFSVPGEHRLHERLMIKLARGAYPWLFGLPSKNRLGHHFDTPDAVVRATFWWNRVRKLAHRFLPGVNWPNHLYNDFHEAIRENPSLRTIVRENVRDLQRRGIVDFLDIDGIWRRHDWRLANHGDALIVLSSLELVLKARERRGAA